MVSSDTESPNSSCSRMIRSQARQRTTPWIAGIGPSSASRRRKALCVSSSLGGAPGEGMLMRPSGPCSLYRITQSRNVWRSIPPIFAASSAKPRRAQPQVPEAFALAPHPSRVWQTAEPDWPYSPP